METFRSRSKEPSALVSDYKPLLSQTEQEDNIIKLYGENLSESDDYSVTDLKAQFEEQ